MFYLFNHWRRFAHIWPRFPGPKEEVGELINQLPGSDDLTGVAQHMMRLIDIYKINLPDVIQGFVIGRINFKIHMRLLVYSSGS